MHGRMSLTVTLAALAVAGLTAPSTAAAQRSGVSFERSEIKVDVDKLRKTVRVDVHNDRSRTARVRVKLTGLGLRDKGTPARTIPTRAAIARRTLLNIPAGGRRAVRLTLRPGIEPRDGTYEGSLALVPRGRRGVVARVPFILVVGKKSAGTPPATSPTPAVSALTVRAERWVPESNTRIDLHDAKIPFRVESGKSLTHAKKGVLLGVLAGDDGSVAEVFYNGETDSLSRTLEAAGIRFDGMGPAGEYKGKIDTLPDSPGGEIDLTLVVKDAWLWALLPLLAGVGVALWRRAYIGAGRASLLLGAREAALGPAFEEARAAFSAAAAGKPWADYDTSDAFEAQSKTLRSDIVVLAQTSFDKLEDGPRKAIEERLTALEDHVAALPGLAAALSRLETLLGQVKELGRPEWLVPEGSDAPAFVVAADRLLKGRKLASLADFAATVAAIEATSKLAAEWPALQREAERAAARVEAVESATLSATDRERVVEARGRLKGAWQQLWEAEDAATIAERELAEAVEEAVASAYRLAGVSPLPEERAEGRRAALREGGETLTLTVPSVLPPVAAGELGRAPVAGEARVKWLRGAVRRGDGWQMLLAGAAAVYTGLEAQYFGHSFGGPWDYVKAFAWGLTATATLDLLAEALRQRVSLRARA